MTETAPKTNIGMNYGLIAGLIITVISLLQYLGGLDTYLSPVSYVSYLVVITMAVLAALKVRRANEGFLEFGAALKVTFTVFAIALLLQTLFIYLLFNYIDVDFKNAVSQEVMNKSEQMMRQMGASDSQIEKIIDEQRNTDQFSFLRVMLGYAITCIVAFIFCLLISVIVKRSKPTFNNI
jgi:hypothetical protein